jgi:hypothetical protein
MDERHEPSMTDLQFKAEQDILDSKRSDSQAAQDVKRKRRIRLAPAVQAEKRKRSVCKEWRNQFIRFTED